ncbi:MAG: methyltransferase domain-containing protein [Anderseniella sp.]
MDVVDLKEFYASKLGLATRRLISSRLRSRLRGMRGARVLGLGYCTPYLDAFSEAECETFAMMPARQGVVHWPTRGDIASVLVDEACLPIPDGTMDFVLVVHGLELTDQLPDMLREIWRVLAPQGRAIMIVPNRRGLWARFDHTPFGHGRPFSRGQLTTLLRNAQFSPAGWTSMLFMPPSSRGFMVRSATLWERAGSWIGPGFSGVIMVEAIKQVYAVSGNKQKKRQLVPSLRPGLFPQPVGVRSMLQQVEDKSA